MSKHNYGCRVIQRLIEKSNEYKPIIGVITKLSTNVEELSMDAYGNYVIQHILEHGTIENVEAVLSCVKKNLPKMSRQKFSSNVIEKALEHSNDVQRKEIVREILKEEKGVNILGEMMRDKFANYVVQKCIEHSDR